MEHSVALLLHKMYLRKNKLNMFSTISVFTTFPLPRNLARLTFESSSQNISGYFISAGISTVPFM